MTTYKSILVLLAFTTLVGALVGCAENQKKRLTPIAAFDLSCPGEQVQLTLLSGRWTVIGAQAAAQGCENKTRYILSPSGWVMNTDVSSTGDKQNTQQSTGKKEDGDSNEKTN